MSNPLVWLWREFKEFFAQLRRWFNGLIDPSSQRPPTPNFATGTSAHYPAEPSSGAQNAPTGRVAFSGTDLPSIEPLETLLNDAWSYLKAQEQIIDEEEQALLALQKKIAINQRWVQFYESSGYPLQPPTPYEFQFGRNRHRCYRQELAIYQQIYTLRQQKIDSLNSNRVAISMMLDNLRSELLKIDSYRTSIDCRFGFVAPDTVYTEADIQAMVYAFARQFKASQTRESRTIANFNQQLTKLTETWRTVGSA